MEIVGNRLNILSAGVGSYSVHRTVRGNLQLDASKFTELCVLLVTRAVGSCGAQK